MNPTVTTYSGGFGASPPIPPGRVVGSPLSVRAIYISNGRRAVELAALDSQAEFAAYQEGPDYGITYARAAAARDIDAAHLGPAISPADLILQSTHSHSAPTLEGLWGPVPIPYLQEVTRGEIEAMVQAARAARPAALEVGTADAAALDDTALAQYDAFPGWSVDPLLSILRAVDPGNGATIATYVTVPAHPDVVCGQCLGELSADYPGVVRTALESQLGGTAVVGPGTLGREETPVQATGFADMDLLATQATTLADAALADARWVTSDTLEGTERFVQFPFTNAALAALNEAWALPPAQRRQVEDVSGEYPADRRDTPPYATGALVGTWLTALRIGDLAYVSMPGEPFPEVRETIARATGARLVVSLSKAQDDLGYFYLSWVAPFGAAVYPSDTFTNSVAPEAGDVIIDRQLTNLSALGFATTTPVPTPLPTNVGQTTSPGLQVVGGPFVGDAAQTGGLSVAMLAVYSPPSLPEGTLDYGLPVGGVPLAQSAKGPVRWSFGDGTQGTSGYHEFAGTDRAPTVFTHDFAVGAHQVHASVTSATGKTASWSFEVVVYPQLNATVSERHPAGNPRSVTYDASAAGGDGRYLAYRWRFPDGTTASGTSVTHTFARGIAPGVLLTVTDATGQRASASA